MSGINYGRRASTSNLKNNYLAPSFHLDDRKTEISFHDATPWQKVVMKGLIFSVKKYSIHDGRGIRVTFFMKGCSLSCIWCHNPEGISPFPEEVIQKNRVGEREFSNREEVGKFYSVEDILEILDKEKIFFDQSKGGVTFSGGEPMLQFEFLLEALKACKANGYHTAVDTSGYSQAQNSLPRAI
ncbi:MAG: 4Fe-4S cluster-binding domain-containing protein [Bacteroidota bacterium]